MSQKSQSILSPVEQEIHLRDYFRVLKKRLLVVVIFFLITVSTVVLMTWSMTPIYKSELQVLVERNSDTKLSGQGVGIPYDPQFEETQYQIIKSQNVIERVVKQLQLDTKYRDHFIASGWFTFIKKSIKDLIHKIPVIGTANSSPTQSEQEPEAETVSNQISSIIRKNIKVDSVKGSHIVSISYSDPNPEIAQLIVNSIAQAYKDELLEMKMQNVNYSLVWLTRKADEEKQRLQELEKNLQEYTRKYDVITVENKVAIIPQKIAGFSTQLAEAQSQRNELEEVYQQITSRQNDSAALESLPIFANNQTLQLLRNKISETDKNIAELSKKYGPKHPQMIKAENERKVLVREKEKEIKRITQLTQNDLALAYAREKNIENLLQDTKKEVLRLNERLMQYQVLERDVETSRVLYDSLLKNVKEQGATNELQDVKVWAVQKAQIPERPDKPRKKLNILLGIVFGSMGGIGLAFFLEYLDNSIGAPDEIEKRFKVPVLGVVENISGPRRNLDTLLEDEPQSSYSESYKMIRSMVLLSTADHPPRSILITSSVPSEGKTTVTVNFAKTLAMLGNRVLTIDCDLRKPNLHAVFGLFTQEGLSAYLAGTADLKSVLVKYKESIDVIPAGQIPPNPSELLSSRKMKELLVSMSKEYDFILLDSAPILSVTDSLTLASLTDGTILITQANKSTNDMLSKSLKRLQSIESPLLGIIVNRAKKMNVSDYNYLGYYGSYGPSGKKRKAV